MIEANVEDVLVEVPGGQVFVRRWGREHASSLPVVLLHDSLGSVEQWRDFPALLAHRLDRPVIAYDRGSVSADRPRAVNGHRSISSRKRPESSALQCARTGGLRAVRP
jgi:pimeloyl-ACP methyl ester carboxylesterase